ncbi:hypothetical protein [Olivibacter sp. XZL3]|uniref:hypothetical protein n=1 Tax=Olivibacter sp. XZL3 TaxID=1735116 RepID=UPI0010661F88|nr:hypothetical protein [Olivibacter sp. XZL3]
MTRISFLFLLFSVIIYSCKKDDGVNQNALTPHYIDTLEGIISSDIVLQENANYLLKGQVFVQDASLTIPKGVTIYVEKADSASNKGSLVVLPGAKLFVNGTDQEPVLFTSAATEKLPGDWGALVILGKAPINSKTLQVPGIDNKLANCGGSDKDDDSGSIQFLRLAYCGGLNAKGEDEWALDKVSGLCLGAVGSKTTLSHVMVSYSRDDAFQFFGGNVGAKYLIAYNSGDDDYDFDHGYQGNLQFIISYRNSAGDRALRANGIESLNDADASSKTPYTHPVISNATIIGPSGNATNTNLNQGVYIRKNTRFSIYNSIVANYPQGGLMVCNKTRPLLMESHQSTFKFNLVYCEDNTRSFTWDHNGQEVSLDKVLADPALTSFATNQDNRNTVIETVSALKLSSVFPQSGAPQLGLQPDSPASTGAKFSESNLNDFFDQVSFRGAIGTDDWTATNWVKWD